MCKNRNIVITRTFRKHIKKKKNNKDIKSIVNFVQNRKEKILIKWNDSLKSKHYL